MSGMPEIAVTVLGFDFGLRRIGCAVGQTITGTASPLCTLIACQGVPQWNEVDRLLKEWQPDGLVVGMPFNMDGSDQAITRAAKTFAAALKERYHLSTYGTDERLTTLSARQQVFDQKGAKGLRQVNIDEHAARIILEAWLAEPEADRQLL
jgi:putative Holliday junction resolvase